MALIDRMRRSKHISGTVPSTWVKRDFLYSKSLGEVQLKEIVDDLLEAEQFIDALLFLESARKMEEIKTLEITAIDRGDFFLYDACRKARKADPDRGELAALARKAEKMGKFCFSMNAFELAGKTSEVERVKARFEQLVGNEQKAEDTLAGGAQQA